jgi:hypothetical protein
MSVSFAISQRRAVRRATRTRCHAVGELGFELLGELALDLSPRGMLLACDAPAALGDPVLVSLLTPGSEPIWLDAEAEVTRIVQGYRHGDPGFCVGLHFKYLERVSRIELLSRLAGMPPPIPQRRPRGARHRVDLPNEVHATIPSVVVRSVFSVSRAVRGIPAGVFAEA